MRCYYWNNFLWCDETNTNLFGSDRKSYVQLNLFYSGIDPTVLIQRKRISAYYLYILRSKVLSFRVRHLTFFSTSAYFVNGNTWSSCLIWQIISFILPPNEYGCVYAWTTLGSGPAIDLQKMPILAKKSTFQMKLIMILAGK